LYPKIELTMTKRVNYEDDIFFLLLLLRRLKEGLKLKIDMEHFGSKIVDDVLFIDEKIETLLNLLKNQTLLLREEEYLIDLKKLTRLFIEFLNDLIDKKFPGSYYFSDLLMSFEKIRDKHEKFLEDIKVILKDIETKERDAEQIVSSEEFKFLLSNGTEDTT